MSISGETIKLETFDFLKNFFSKVFSLQALYDLPHCALLSRSSHAALTAWVLSRRRGRLDERVGSSGSPFLDILLEFERDILRTLYFATNGALFKCARILLKVGGRIVALIASFPVGSRYLSSRPNVDTPRWLVT